MSFGNVKESFCCIGQGIPSVDDWLNFAVLDKLQEKKQILAMDLCKARWRHADLYRYVSGAFTGCRQTAAVYRSAGAAGKWVVDHRFQTDRPLQHDQGHRFRWVVSLWLFNFPYRWWPESPEWHLPIGIAGVPSATLRTGSSITRCKPSVRRSIREALRSG
jgi:hypothetical protein